MSHHTTGNFLISVIFSTIRERLAKLTHWKAIYYTHDFQVTFFFFQSVVLVMTFPLCYKLVTQYGNKIHSFMCHQYLLSFLSTTFFSIKKLPGFISITKILQKLSKNQLWCQPQYMRTGLFTSTPRSSNGCLYRFKWLTEPSIYLFTTNITFIRHAQAILVNTRRESDDDGGAASHVSHLVEAKRETAVSC